jgi:5-methylcytosine-specific restriction endonuclease McrA
MKNKLRGNCGKNNGNWNGGVSEYPNHYYLKKQRLVKLNNIGFVCEKCKIKKAKEIHHKDRNKSNHKLNNLMALCVPCHLKIHAGEYGRPRKYPQFSHIKNLKDYRKQVYLFKHPNIRRNNPEWGKLTQDMEKYKINYRKKIKQKEFLNNS